MRKTLTLALVVLTAGCAFAMRAELLNPLNKSGRIETSAPQEPKPVTTPPPAATPTPSPTPGGSR